MPAEVFREKCTMFAGYFKMHSKKITRYVIKQTTAYLKNVLGLFI